VCTCRAEYKNLGKVLTASVGKVPIVALTATATAQSLNIIQRSLSMQAPTVIRSPLFRPNLNVSVVVKAQPNMQLAQLQQSLQSSEMLAVVFCNRRKECEELCKRTRTKLPGLRVATFHSALDAAVKESILKWCREGKINVLFCTSAFGLGIDVTVRTVLHWDVPQSMCHYVQEIGRAGRDGLPSMCKMFVASDWYQKRCKQAYKNVANVTRIVDEARQLQKYVSCECCRHEHLLRYFAAPDITTCGNNCDICRRVEGCGEAR
jgi:ATP-dependent DNA helicase RecQ